MRRSRLAFLLLLAVLVVGATSACGTDAPTTAAGEAPAPASAEDAPAPGDLAADALAALEREESAHYELDATVEVAGGGQGFGGDPISLHVEGDADEDAVTADVSVEAAAQRFAARLLARPHELYVQFMGSWYGGELPDAGSELDAELATPARVRRHFEDVFVGEVSPGPLVDGAATWSYEGTLDPDGLRALVRLAGGTLSNAERRQLEELAHAAALRFLVGRDDLLPRRIELDLDLDLAALGRLEGGGAGMSGAEGIRANVVLRLSDFGKRVELEPPRSFRPLEELAQAFFGGAV